jgi:hypothetical protein
MTNRTLLTRIHSANQLKQIERLLSRSFEGLDVEAKILGVAADRWVQVSLGGSDEGIASNYIAQKIGFCPVSLGEIKRFSTLKGYVTSGEKSREELFVDVGVFEPETVYATVPLSYLQAVLVDGRKIALAKIAELFGFCEGLPISIKIVKLDAEERRMEAEVSATQVEKYVFWRESLLDKLIVLGASLHDVKRALHATGLNRDVVGVEPMGMFEHALTCKLGTDAAGLISKIGRKLRNARFTVFNPRKIRKFLESSSAL